jgi:hypothetical protein
MLVLTEFTTDSNLQSSFDKRDSLMREKAYTREVTYAFRLVSQAKCSTSSEIILYAGALRVYFSSRLSKVDCS